MPRRDEPTPPAAVVTLDAEALRPLIEATVEAVLARVERDRARVPDSRLAFPEGERSERPPREDGDRGRRGRGGRDRDRGPRH